MIKVTARPIWQFPGPGRIGRSGGHMPITTNTVPMTIKQTMLPRSLDLSFEFKYRR